MFRHAILAAVVSLPIPASADEPAPDTALEHSVDQLRDAVGCWDVVTEFLAPDGTVARSAEGSYEFSWVVPDRVVSGRSEVPEMKQVSAILFYVNETKRFIEMVSVSRDGMLWTMTGPLGGEERLSQEFTTADGGTARLRFTRFNVSSDEFESRMEFTSDGGESWQPGNHQVFRRTDCPASGVAGRGSSS